MIKNTVKIAVGLLMLVNVLIGYLPNPAYLVEFTCISNTFGGLLLLTDGVWNAVKKKEIPNALYLNAALGIFVVFLVCMMSFTGTHKFNFAGAFFFLHVVDPIAFVLCYLFFVNERSRKAGTVLTAPAMVMLYLLFDWAYSLHTGKFVYGFLEPGALTLFRGILLGAVIYAFLCLLGASIFMLNRLIHERR